MKGAYVFNKICTTWSCDRFQASFLSIQLQDCEKFFFAFDNKRQIKMSKHCRHVFFAEFP